MKITVKNVTKYIRKALILDHVSVEFESGKIYGLVGPNGSGKTMLIRLITGLITPTEGEVWIDEKKLGKDMDFPDSVGLLIENPAFLDYYTGYRNLELLAEIKGRIGDAEIRKAIEDVGLDPDDKRKYGKYSLGMKQRLGIAAALMEEPELICLDEPTNALDEGGSAQIRELILREKARGALIVIASHDAALMEDLADEIYTIYDGKVTKKES